MNNDKGLLSGSITILIGAVIAIMALVRGPWQVWLLLGVFTLWGLWVVLILLLPYMQQAITEEESTGVLQRLIEGKDLTLYGLSNAVTRFSQDVDSYDRATALEGIGYNILSMPRQQWNRINQMAA